MTGIVTHVQRFSTHDGPGVRTTVFLKGCSNRCAWCHNPETLDPRPRLRFDAQRCARCGDCVAVCPVGAHTLSDGSHAVDRRRCRACGTCVGACLNGALTLVGRAVEVDELLQEVLADAPYYRHSGGGITLSGGEPVLQAEFAEETLAMARRAGLHTALQTAGNYPWEWLEPLLPLVDLVMYDLKVADPDAHRRYVGAGQDRIVENLARLGAAGCKVAVRTPVVGGVNDNEQEIGALARLASRLPDLAYYELIPYHPLGEAKRASLGLSDGATFTTPTVERMRELAAEACRHVADVRS